MRRGTRAASAALLPPLLLAACGSPPRTAPVPGAPADPTSAPPVRASAGEAGSRADGPLADLPGEGEVGSSAARPPPLPATPPRRTRVRDAALVETSGLAFSRRDAGVLWAINDGGHAPALHALALDGRPLGRWPLEAGNRDWEDLAAFRFDGEPHLLIADTGDNLRRRDEVVLHLVAEPVARGPGSAPGTPLVPRLSLRFRYEDGPHDVEAVAVDEPSGTVWLLPKAPVAGGRGVAGGAYVLPLPTGYDLGGGGDGTPEANAGAGTEARAGADELPLARLATTLAPVSRGLVGRLATSIAGVDLAQPTAFDIAADGRSACLLTYRRVRCFARADGEDWSETLARPGTPLAAHGLDQAEALALSPDGRAIAFTSEGATPPLLVRGLRREPP